jgi:hypothetical protein
MDKGPLLVTRRFDKESAGPRVRKEGKNTSFPLGVHELDEAQQSVDPELQTPGRIEGKTPLIEFLDGRTSVLKLVFANAGVAGG